MVDPTAAAAEAAAEGVEASLSSLDLAVAAGAPDAAAGGCARLEEEGSGALLRADEGLPERGGVCLFGDGSGAGATAEDMTDPATVRLHCSLFSTSRPWLRLRVGEPVS
jgi:hypothetical protein